MSAAIAKERLLWIVALDRLAVRIMDLEDWPRPVEVSSVNRAGLMESAAVDEAMVERALGEWRRLEGHQSDAVRIRAALTEALAQRPTAVDEAVERMRRGPDRLWQADLVGGKISIDRMHEILTAALCDRGR